MRPFLHTARAAIFSLVLALAAACGDDGSATAPPDDAPAADSLRQWRVSPPLTGAGVVEVNGDHVVMLDEGSRNELFVFYPGTKARPDQYEEIVRRAAELGYHALALSYVNTLSVNFEVCIRHPADRACHEAVRLEILTGVESGYDPPDVDPANGAFRRLTLLLQYLAAEFPGDGWDRYLTGGALRWDRIVVAGHSQGGGHAAMTAKLYAVPRALLFGATEPNPWTLEPFATPVGRFFALAHADEQNVAGIVRSWGNIGIPGAPTPADGDPAGWDDAQRLLTSRQDCVGAPDDRGLFHNCYIVDEYLPRDGRGRPVHLALWDHMLSAADGDARSVPGAPGGRRAAREAWSGGSADGIVSGRESSWTRSFWTGRAYRISACAATE
jgi:pimeloyl-ACP methyl ester carboxylesterase